tara:strand:+ start:44 stop:697 length:654 start_codon:yes stop_codon:yes gene_type:complete
MKVAVILAGCGYLDGAEIRESVLALLELDKAGASVQCFAPDINQYHVINHLIGQEQEGQVRNVLQESARIARGEVEDLVNLNEKEFDALVIPGGFGVAKNLSDLAFKGPDAQVLPEFKAVLDAFIQAKKPIGAICISPAVLVAALKDNLHPTVTIGDDEDGLIPALGATHTVCKTSDIVIDDVHNIITCSAYMREDALKDIAQGIEKLVHQVIIRCN